MGNGRVYFAGPPYNADGRRTCVGDDAARDRDEDFDVAGVNRLRNRYKALGGAAWIGRGDRTIGLYETGGSTGDRQFRPWLCDCWTCNCDRCSGKRMCGLSGCCKLHFDAMDAKCGSAGVSYTIDSLLGPCRRELAGYGTFYFRDYSDLDRARQKWCLCRDFGMFGGGAGARALGALAAWPNSHCPICSL